MKLGRGRIAIYYRCVMRIYVMCLIARGSGRYECFVLPVLVASWLLLSEGLFGDALNWRVVRRLVLCTCSLVVQPEGPRNKNRPGLFP